MAMTVVMNTLNPFYRPGIVLSISGVFTHLLLAITM